MIVGSIARRYAKALFKIGEEKGNLLGLTREVQRMAEVWQESGDLRATMNNPLVEKRTKREIWDGIIRRLGISVVGKNFLALLFDKTRYSHLPQIARELGVLADRKENRLRADVISAGPLPEDTVVKIKSALQRRTGKVVVISESEDPAILGGLITRVGDLMLDGSLKTQLARMKEAMLGRS